MPYSYVPPTPPKQQYATSGRKFDINPMLQSYYQSLIPGMQSYTKGREILDLEDEAKKESARRWQANRELQQEQLGLEGQRLGQSEEEMALQAEMANQQAKTGLASMGLSGASLGLQAYPTVSKLWAPASNVSAPTSLNVASAPWSSAGATGAAEAGTAAGASSGQYAALGGSPAFTTYGTTATGAAPAAPAGSMGGLAAYAKPAAGVAAIEAAHQALKGKTDALARKNIGGEREWKTGEMMATRAAQGFMAGGPVGAGIGAAEGLVEANSSRIGKEIKRTGKKVLEEAARPVNQVVEFFGDLF